MHSYVVAIAIYFWNFKIGCKQYFNKYNFQAIINVNMLICWKHVERKIVYDNPTVSRVKPKNMATMCVR